MRGPASNAWTPMSQKKEVSDMIKRVLRTMSSATAVLTVAGACLLLTPSVQSQAALPPGCSGNNGDIHCAPLFSSTICEDNTCYTCDINGCRRS